MTKGFVERLFNATRHCTSRADAFIVKTLRVPDWSSIVAGGGIGGRRVDYEVTSNDGQWICAHPLSELLATFVMGQIQNGHRSLQDVNDEMEEN